MIKQFQRSLLSICVTALLLGCTPKARDMLDPRHWPIPLPTDNIWTEMSRHWALPSKYDERPEIQTKIHWYQQHPEALKSTIIRATPYLYYVYQQTREHEMPAEIALIPFVESEYNPFAHSWAGAAGIWQLMPGTADGLGLEINWWYDGRRDLIASTDAALGYLERLHRSFNQNWLLAIAAYDAGVGRVHHTLSANPSEEVDLLALNLPGETSHYVRKLLAIKAIIDKPGHYGIEIPKLSNHAVLVEVDVDHQIELAQAAKLAGISIEDMRLYNPGFRRWSTPPGGPNDLLVPLEAAVVLSHALESLPQNAWVKWTKHTVKSGDTLSTIAHHYHTRTSILMQSNQLKGTRIHVGDTLLVPIALKHAPSTLPSRLKPGLITGDNLPGPKYTVHVVKAGDSLSGIAKHHRVKTSQIIFWNNLSYKPKLKPGTKLRIWHKKPSKPAKSIRVKSGDSLSVIAHRHHTSVTAIVRLNKLKSNIIRVGQSLRMPPATR